MRTEVKMPKTITTMAEYEEWVNSFNTERQDLEIRMKRRSNFYPYSFAFEKDGSVQYLISDGVSYGRCKIINFNRVFRFTLLTYS